MFASRVFNVVAVGAKSLILASAEESGAWTLRATHDRVNSAAIKGNHSQRINMSKSTPKVLRYMLRSNQS
jgi:hypothetical protein